MCVPLMMKRFGIPPRIIIYIIRIFFRLFPLVFMFRIKSHPILSPTDDRMWRDLYIYMTYTVVFVSTSNYIIIIVETSYRLYLKRETISISSNPTAFFEIERVLVYALKLYENYRCYTKVHASYHHIHIYLQRYITYYRSRIPRYLCIDIIILCILITLYYTNLFQFSESRLSRFM